MNINCAVPLEIKDFSGATITRLETGITNGFIIKSKDAPAVTERPAIDIIEQGPTPRGRGIYYWDDADATYIVNNDTLYKDSYANAISSVLVPNTKRVYFHQLDNFLMIVDPQADLAYTISLGGAVTQIAGSIPATLTPGGVILNGYFFVMDDNGFIWNSDLNDPGTFSPGAFVNAEREEDGGIYLGKHHNYIVAFGDRTIEFFYDNSNLTNSPLNRREDLSHNIGCADGESVWENGDKTTFIGTDRKGTLSVYQLKEFSVNKVSDAGLDSLISQALTRDGYQIIGTGISAHGHEFYLITLYSLSVDIVAEATYVLDLETGIWFIWRTGLPGYSAFEVMASAIRAGSRAKPVAGIMVNGDVFRVNNDFNPQDSIGASVYVDAGYVDVGYISDVGGSGVAIDMKIRTGQFDGGVNSYKFATGIKPQMSATDNTQTLTVTAYDNNESDPEIIGTVDTSVQEDNIIGGGRFLRRNHELGYSGNEQVWIESLEVDIE